MSAVGAKLSWSGRVMNLGILLVVYAVLTSCGTPAGAIPVTGATATTVEKSGSVTIRITNPNVETAIARVIGTNQIATLERDTLSLESCFHNEAISIWSPGFYIEEIKCDGNVKQAYSIALKPLGMDNPNYAWVGADKRANPEFNCVTCHADASLGLNEYTEWNVDGHSRVFEEPYFWNIYMGTNLHRNPAIEDGLGFRLDYPNENGNCAFCHAPASLQLLQQGTDLASWVGPWSAGRVNVETEGITCDICHKVIDVVIGADGRPLPEQPGILSLVLSRPNPGELIHIGPWPDHKPGISEIPGAVKHVTACSPIFGESKFCAACHYGKFFGTVVYNSYGEWLDSDYSKKEINGEENPMYRACQDCHMTASEPISQSSWKARAACSSENQLFRDFSHNMMKRDNTGVPVLIEGAATVRIDASREQGKIKVTVTVTNTQAGHKLPTDSPLRHLILLVEARDEDDKLLAQAEGPTIPEWGGSGGQTQDYAGRPGVIYANLLKDKITNKVPSVSYWNTTVPAWEGSDTRLFPFQGVTSEYSFAAPSRGVVKVTAYLIYRYAFIEIMRQKGWDRPDKLVNWDEYILPE